MTTRSSIILLGATALVVFVLYISCSFIYGGECRKSATGSDKLAIDVAVSQKTFLEQQQTNPPLIIKRNQYLVNHAALIPNKQIECTHDGCSEAEALFINNKSHEAEIILIKKISMAIAGIGIFELSDWELYRSILRVDGRLTAYMSALQSIPEHMAFKQSLLVEHLSYLSQNSTDAETQAFALSFLSANPENELLVETYAEILVAQEKEFESNALVAHLQKLNPENAFLLRFLRHAKNDQSLSK
jgi:hypothetical protein